MLRSREICLTAVALAFSFGPGPVSAEDAKNVETADFDAPILAGWVGKVLPDPKQQGSAVLLENVAGRTRVLITVNPGPPKGSPEEAAAQKDVQERPGMVGASFVMPMVLKVGGPATMVYDEVNLAGEPSAATCVIAVGKADDFTAFHGSGRVVGDRVLAVAVITRGKQGAAAAGADADAALKAQMQAAAQGYKLLRELRLKKRP